MEKTGLGGLQGGRGGHVKGESKRARNSNSKQHSIAIA